MRHKQREKVTKTKSLNVSAVTMNDLLRKNTSMTDEDFSGITLGSTNQAESEQNADSETPI